MKNNSLKNLLKESMIKFYENEGFRDSAAMAYYALITIIPLIIFLIILSGIIFGNTQLLAEFIKLLGKIGGESLSEIIIAIIESAKKRTATSLVSVLFVIIGSTVLFSHVKKIIEKAWRIKAEKKEGKKDAVKYFLAKKISSIVLIIIMLFILILSSIINIFLNSLEKNSMAASNPLTNFIIIESLNYFIVFFVVFAFLYFLYRILPEEKFKFIEIWHGLTCTSFLLVIGFVLSGIYLDLRHLKNFADSIGVILGLLILFYYLSITFIFGTYFSYILAKNHQKKN